MRRVVPLFLAALFLCGFGAGPFWGENKGGSSTPPPDFDLTNIAYVHDETLNNTGITFPSYDVGTADGILIGVCTQRSSSLPLFSSGTEVTYGGQQVPQVSRLFAHDATADYPEGGLYLLNAPPSGSNDVVVTYTPGGTSYSVAVIAMRVYGQDPVQDGALDSQTRGGVGSITQDISGTVAGNLAFHLVCGRGNVENDPTSSNLTVRATDHTNAPDLLNSVRWIIAFNDGLPGGTVTNRIDWQFTARSTGVLWEMVAAP